MSDERSPFLTDLPAARFEPLSAEQEQERRRLMAARIQSASHELKSRKIARIQRRRVGGAMLAVAAGALLWLGVSGSPSSTELGPKASLTPPAAPAESGPKSAPDQMSESARTEVSQFGARIVTRAGSEVRVSVQEKGEIETENVQLEKGRVALSVPKLTSSQRLTVTTPEAVVEVRGTEFDVTRTFEKKEPITRVSVTEGLVAVRPVTGGEVLLNPGDSWSSRGEPVQDIAPSVAPSRQPAVHPARTDEAVVEANESAEEEKQRAASELAEQNRLYQAALQAKRSGLSEAAHARFQELLERYPRSPLVPSARRELRRLKEEPEP